MILIGLGYWRSPKYMIFLHDGPFRGQGSLPEFLDLTPRCQIDSPLHHAEVRFDSPLYHAAERFDSPLHHAAERFDSPLQSAAARFDSSLHNAAERFDSPLQNVVGKFDSPLHHAAGRFLQQSLTCLPAASYSGEIWLPTAWCNTLILITPRIRKQIKKKLRIWIMAQGGYYCWKKRRWKISRYCFSIPFKGTLLQVSAVRLTRKVFISRFSCQQHSQKF